MIESSNFALIFMTLNLQKVFKNNFLFLNNKKNISFKNKSFKYFFESLL